ncbi:MAG TPA: hypothetical protein VFE37_26610 [Chloroflexota bacterium]|nr:hypothetical protein [Chloroflexota bacterium]
MAMDIDLPETLEEEAEATIRDEIASLRGADALAGVTVRARRDPDDYNLLRVVLRYGAQQEDAVTLALENPAVRHDLDGAFRQAARELLGRVSAIC